MVVILLPLAYIGYSLFWDKNRNEVQAQDDVDGTAGGGSDNNDEQGTNIQGHDMQQTDNREEDAVVVEPITPMMILSSNQSLNQPLVAKSVFCDKDDIASLIGDDHNNNNNNINDGDHGNARYHRSNEAAVAVNIPINEEMHKPMSLSSFDDSDTNASDEEDGLTHEEEDDVNDTYLKFVEIPVRRPKNPFACLFQFCSDSNGSQVDNDPFKIRVNDQSLTFEILGNQGSNALPFPKISYK